MRNLNLKELAQLLKEFALGGRFLKQSPHWTPEQMRAWQFLKIQKLVAHAWANVPFYHDHYQAVGFELGDLKTWDDFKQLPLVNKDDVIANYPERILRSGSQPDDYIVSRSSGSSGKVLDICYDSEAMVIYSLAGLRLYQMGFNYRPWHKQLYVYTSPYPMNSVFGLYPMVHVPTLASIDKIAAAIETHRPELLVCYPSHLKQIEPRLSSKARAGLRAVSVNSEMSTQAERNFLAERLGCPVLDEYSSEELTRIAAQCACGRYHLFEDINYMELIDINQQSGMGTLVGTNLHNYAMPMIRYVQNDLGIIQESDCGCTWKFRELSNLQGRKNDSFLMPSGQEISSGFLLDATYEILLTWRTAVSDFCLVQYKVDDIVLQIIPAEGWSTDLEAQIKQQFGDYFEASVHFRIDLVTCCEKTQSGKRNPIISHCSRGS
jgi:phenylacetate-CoA ligase